ncbi:MAG: MFS transporter [Pseudomonadota bacterium]
MLSFINRNLAILFVCQLVFVSGTVILVTVGGLVGYELAPDPALGTLPVALMVVGTACATIPASLTMQRLGRRSGFLIATGIATLGASGAVFALSVNNFVLFCMGTSLVGASLGFSQQFRFAAAESVTPDKVSFAVSFILLGSIVGAIVGPGLVTYAADIGAENPYRLAFQGAIALYALAAIVLIGLRPIASTTDEVDSIVQAPRSVLEIIRGPKLLTAVLAGVVGQGVMTYVMTATPISMNVSDGYSLQETSAVIRAHVIAMYLPSLVTPFLIERFGVGKVMVVGVVTFLATLAIGLAGKHYLHYWFAMVMLGVGWNFLFVGGTTLLVQAYRANERFKSQALNDFSVFTMSALASLLAGTILHQLGWNMVLLSTVPLLVVMLVMVGYWRKSESNDSSISTLGR